MMRKRQRFFQRLVTWLAMLGYALIVSGLPLGGFGAVAGHSAVAAKRLAAKDRSARFPCQDTPCGCLSARQCFTDCCCRSPAETLAWARANGVTADVLLALEQRAAGPVEPKAGGCCAADASEDLSEVCFEYDYLAATGQTAAAAESDDPAVAVVPVSAHAVVLKSLLACNGLLAEWLAAVTCLPPSLVSAVSCGEWPPEVLSLPTVSAACERDEPAAPPPRVG